MRLFWGLTYIILVESFVKGGLENMLIKIQENME